MRNIHLLVLIHGMWGNPNHLAEMSRIIQETKGSVKNEGADEGDDVNETAQLEVLVAQSNIDQSTYDGIDWGGERIANEVVAKVSDVAARGDQVTKFSIAGYSLGGLLSRYVIGALNQRNFFDDVTPCNFATFATPHLGLLLEDTFFSSLKAALGPRILSRTGEQFYAVDKWGTTEWPLLEIMADKNHIFYQALLLFPQKRIYGNAVNDLTVPYATALIDTKDPFAYRNHTGLTVDFDPKYDPLILEYSIPSKTPEKKPAPTTLSLEWFKKIKPSSYLPPPLQLRFPLNVFMTLLLPLIFPTFIVLIIVRLSWHTFKSRRRIKLLEKQDSPTERLVQAFARLERQMEGAMVDLMDEAPGSDVDDGEDIDSDTSNGVSKDSGSTLVVRRNGQADTTVALNGSALEDGDFEKPKSCNIVSMRRRRRSVSATSFTSNPAPAPPRAFLTPAQARMAASLNALPGLTKHMAFIEPIRNSHATIVSRDVKSYDFHKRGWGVLRHWADGFAL